MGGAASAKGIDVPKLGLGTWLLEGPDCREAVEHALRLGYRHVDTAQAYENEEEVGAGLRAARVERGDVFVTTKVRLRNLEPSKVAPSVDDSLQRLGVDRVDLLLAHWPNPDVPVEATADALRGVLEDGKTRAVGVSNYPPSLLRRALTEAPIVCNQVEYHPFLSQDALLAIAGECDLVLTAYSPLARGAVLDDETVRSVGDAHGVSPAQVTLAWLVAQPRVAAIPKASSAAHREANLAALDVTLSEEDMGRIAALDRGERQVEPSWAPDWER
jgi:2,5-diketo-D-gluconate reductase B